MRQADGRCVRTLGFAAVLCTLFLCGRLLLAQTQATVTPALKVKTELVLVDVQVSQKKTGDPVGSLRPDDFEVYEDGVQQRISFLARDELPISVVQQRPVLRSQGPRAVVEVTPAKDPAHCQGVSSSSSNPGPVPKICLPTSM